MDRRCNRSLLVEAEGLAIDDARSSDLGAEIVVAGQGGEGAVFVGPCKRGGLESGQTLYEDGALCDEAVNLRL